MDKKDKQILMELQSDVRKTTADIADAVGLSVSPCARRIRKLESDGVIAGYQVKLDRKKMGLMMTFFVNVRLSNHRDQVIDAFEEAIAEMTEVISCHVISGSYDYLLEVVSKDLPHYESFMRKLQTLNMVQDINTNLAIRAVKQGSPLTIV
ncbi:MULTISPECIES: Lrp/AsnC family transcriptional regulator [Photobacterium]|uniref:AsnC family transcriptional regulator n=1 Tax=Photobacterium ganghwense TaxID=320778 RepID=A0A0J1GY54_9GAMM|nr:MULTISPECIES: Lrp/AsnC family transcriptional regulator [Photobacterium]KLV04591.1 AsnC family transcriptional regulator [Photobacterium ganghwense]MBV1841917.1 Lrp/AsnC family transcriptional regulator [Photobacterium ganghwense]PSU09953.1 Lrp/AsnC family transcriptional regulator [Photobacterium ganghwense]QSV17359.1 Lrp/AsnC family transcriptional regulator [Photobacterium ganghwense]